MTDQAINYATADFYTDPGLIDDPHLGLDPLTRELHGSWSEALLGGRFPRAQGQGDRGRECDRDGGLGHVTWPSVRHREWRRTSESSRTRELTD